MMFPISYLVYSVNYLVCLLITQQGTIRSESITQMHVGLGFMVYNNHPCPQDDVSYKLPCLQCKLPCMFTNNKDQSGWRV